VIYSHNKNNEMHYFSNFSACFAIPYCCIGLTQFLFGVLILVCLFCLLGTDRFDIQGTVHRDILL
jgi:hypothetical protein